MWNMLQSAFHNLDTISNSSTKFSQQVSHIDPDSDDAENSAMVDKKIDAGMLGVTPGHFPVWRQLMPPLVQTSYV